MGARLVDDYFFCKSARTLLFNPKIVRFMELVFKAKPILTQSLRFNYGSQQAIHQDTAFVRMNSPMKLAAVWIALEDIQPGTGELQYFPGSHRWEGFLFSGRFKHYDETRDGREQLDAWHQWIQDEAKVRNVKAEAFLCQKGRHTVLACGFGTWRGAHYQAWPNTPQPCRALLCKRRTAAISLLQTGTAAHLS